MPLTRSQKKEINRKFIELEGIDTAQVSIEKIQSRVDDICELLDLYDVVPESEYWKRLERFQARVNGDSDYKKPEKKQELHPDFTQGRRDYVGACEYRGTLYVARIIAAKDYFFVRRTHNRIVKLNWRFNIEGRLDLVDTTLLSDNVINNIVQVLPEEILEWKKAEARYWKLPYSPSSLNPDFVSLPIDQLYESILRLGHNTTKNIVENLRSGRVRDAPYPQPNQRQLREIVNDAAAFYMLKKASELMPSIDQFSERTFFIMYNV